MLTAFEHKLHKIRVDRRLADLEAAKMAHAKAMQEAEQLIQEYIKTISEDLENLVTENPTLNSYALYLYDPFPAYDPEDECQILRPKLESALLNLISDFKIEVDSDYHRDHGEDVFYYKITWHPPSSVTPVEPEQE